MSGSAADGEEDMPKSEGACDDALPEYSPDPTVHEMLVKYGETRCVIS